MGGRPPRFLPDRYRTARKRRRRIRVQRLRFALIAIGIGMVAVLGFSLRAHRTEPKAVRVQTPPAVPYSSAFIRHGAPWDDEAAAAVARIASPVVNGPAFPAQSAAVIEDPRTGRVLYEHNAHMGLTPASTMKVIVAATALHALGAQHRFQTDIVTDGAVQDGTLSGDLYLVGGGDPDLATDDLRAAVRQIRADGVRLVDGAVVADGSLYGVDEVNKTWDADDLQYGWAAPPSAVTIDNGSVQFTITPDPDGGVAAVDVDPPGAAHRIVGHVATAPADADNTLRIDPLPDGSGFALSGAIPYGAPQKYWRAVAHPTAAAADVFKALAFSGGLAVTGDATTGKAPAGAATTLWSHRSGPLAAMIAHMAFVSDNHYAEQLLRAVGANAYGSGTLHEGLTAEHAFLASLGADDAALRLVDGSGLSDDDRVTAAALVAALRSMVAPPDAQAQAALLPRVGMEGTVQYRPIAPDVIGRIRGKDGYIQGASGLAGFVETAHHGVVLYAFLVDDWQQGLDVVWRGEDDILARIARM